MIRQVISIAKKKKKYIGICGQGPSDHVSFAKFLVECGIDSMSLNPDSVLKTMVAVNELESKMKR